MKVSCIILNYNDAKTTERLVSTIKEYEELDSIVIVDNHSTDDSVHRLKRLTGDTIHLIVSSRNGGYGYGNNLGIRYADETLHATHVLIANPDVDFSQSCVTALKESFHTHDLLGVTGAVPVNQAGKRGVSSWKLHGFFGDLMDTGLITRRLMKPWLSDHPEARRKKGFALVDAIPGSLFLADIKAMMDCGLFDERVFLYYEEKILGFQMKKNGYQTLLHLDQTYLHLHSVSIDKSVATILKKQAILHKSKLYYYRNYLKINRVQEWLANGFFQILMFEIWFLTEVAGMSW
ncbi:glycosyltransferase [Clostridium sp. E02]|uniref:glycosyltransferase family 2 protein n=1 Tax=Clostridium sp. E02 TaxID=2487134 RepID=UPI000F526CF7|nr:glycosyltransferase [Clostridium sp. E02]